MQVGTRPTVPLLFWLATLAGAPVAPAQQVAIKDPTLQQQLDKWFSQAARRAPGEWGVAVADAKGQLKQIYKQA